nr:MAG TPA: Protein of unknown function (DUF2612) [Caudoviricetes sp.]
MELTTQEEYARLIKQLLPPGPAWDRGDSTSLLAMMIEVWAKEFARDDGRIRALLREADPRKAVETFDAWLYDWGLPDDCIKAWSSANPATLRTLLLYKIKTVGRQDAAYFIEHAEMFGYRIVVDEFRPHSVQSSTMDACCAEAWRHTWRVDVMTGAGSVMGFHDTLGGVDDALAWWGDRLIECLIRRFMPAHTDLYFGYYSFEGDERSF